MTTTNERGIAMILALFLMTALSVLAGALMFLSQTETYASMNYRMMSQTRYAAESAVQKAANFLVSPSGGYVKPNTTGTDRLTFYNQSVSPVTCVSGCTTTSPAVGSEIFLAPSGSNYPVASVITAFNGASSGTMVVGGTTINYSATAKLITMQDFDSYAGSHDTIQTWEITGIGSMVGSRTATVQVVALVETPKIPANSYAAFATADTCGAMYFHGNVTVDSYDSANAPSTGLPSMDYGGNVGTNGNLEIQGSVDVKGTLSTPRTGVGTCTAGAVTALTEIGNATIGACSTCTTAQSMINLPKAVTWPLPSFSAPTSTVTLDATSVATPVNALATCTALGLTYGTSCTVTAGTPPTLVVDGLGNSVTMPNVVLSGVNIQFNGGPAGARALNVNINSLTTTNSGGDVLINTNIAADLGQEVVLKVAGKNPDGTDMATPIDLAATGWKQNAGAGRQFDASAFQVVYGGTGTLSMNGGNAQTAALIYAPNAAFLFKGTQDLFGSVLARTIENLGNASFHYDRHLASEFYVAGQTMAPTFTWKRSS